MSEENPQDAAQNKPQEEIPQEQPVNIEPADETISSAVSVAEDEQPQTTNYKPEIENMETHAHHLHKAPGHGFAHYFFEFFMLFLAVTLGFLVENMREHYVEQKRGKEYIRSMYEDLKNDTTRINNLLAYDEEKIAALNKMFTCYDTVSKNMKATDCMGILIKHSRSNKGFVLTDRTLRQLANAGGYRLLNKEDADSIIVYENMYKGYQDFQSTVFQSAQDNVRNTLNQLADFKVNSPLQITTAILGADTTSEKLNGPLMFTDDKALLNKWFNELAMYLRTTNGQRNTMIQIKDKAIVLIQYYKTKYHLE